MKDQEIAEAERDVFQLGVLEHAERQTKLLKSLLFRADLVLLLTLIAFVVSLGGVFR